VCSYPLCALAVSASLWAVGDSKPTVSTVESKTSPIEKAIQQQKTEKTLQTEDNLKVLTAFKVAPSQNFFAEQNYRFTRFVQSIFSSAHS